VEQGAILMAKLGAILMAKRKPKRTMKDALDEQAARRVSITIETSTQVEEALILLAHGGLHGRTVENIAEELMRVALRDELVRVRQRATWLLPKTKKK
jgi:hypothetical protein